MKNDFTSNKIKVVSFIDDEDVKHATGFEQHVVTENTKEFKFKVSDNQDRSTRRDNDNNLPISYSESDDSEGVVMFKAPNKVSWPILVSIGIFIFNIIITGSAFYHQQNTFNEKMLERIDANNEKIKDLDQNTYDKNQIDLKFENMRLELQKYIQTTVYDERSNGGNGNSNFHYQEAKP